MQNVEVRRVVEGTTRKGEPFVTLKIEDMEGDPLEVSCRDSDLFGVVRQLRKGDMCDLPVLVMANSQYQFVALSGAPEVLDDEE